MKTECYINHKKLIYKMAWSFSNQTGIEVEELISEFNVVFCEAFKTYEPGPKGKFSTYLFACCSNRLKNLLTARGRKKRRFLIYSDLELPCLSYHPIESFIIYDNFVNNSNPVMRKIARIVSIYSLPRTGHIKPWLRKILLKSFNIKEITEAFDQLHTLYEK